jgi:hypothetical protein
MLYAATTYGISTDYQNMGTLTKGGTIARTI